MDNLRQYTGTDGYPRYEAHVVGVSFQNDDGSSRQAILRRLHRYQTLEQEGKDTGEIVSVWLEPYEYEGENAVRVVSDYGECGNLARDVAAELCNMPGYIVELVSWEVYGGPSEDDPDKKWGMAITMRILSEEQEAQRMEQVRAADAAKRAKQEAVIEEPPRPASVSAPAPKPEPASEPEPAPEPHRGTFVFCSSCGKPVPEGAQFCPACGAATAANRQPAPEPVPVVVQQEDSPCRKNVALLLCFLLGVVGGHRFYTGRIVSGVISVFYGVAWFRLFIWQGARIVGDLPLATFFAAILPLWWLVDVIRIATGYYTDKAGRRLAE